MTDAQQHRREPAELRPDTGMLYRWQMPDSRRGLVVEIEDDDGPIVFACVTGGRATRTQPAKHLNPDEARWLAQIMPSVLASIEAYELRADQ